MSTKSQGVVVSQMRLQLIVLRPSPLAETIFQPAVGNVYSIPT